MSLLDRASGAGGISTGSTKTNTSIRERSKKHLTRLVLTLYAEYATLNTETKRKELA